MEESNSLGVIDVSPEEETNSSKPSNVSGFILTIILSESISFLKYL